MRDRGWIVAQFAVACTLLALSLTGIVGLLVFDLSELTFSFGGAIQAFAVFPGAVVSLVVNALIMRRHRARRGLAAVHRHRDGHRDRRGGAELVAELRRRHRAVECPAATGPLSFSRAQ